MGVGSNAEKMSADAMASATGRQPAEQARGMRLPGQQSDGTFTANKSRRIAASQGELLDEAKEQLAALLALVRL